LPQPKFAFGPFQLLPVQRLLLKRGKPVALGSRALDVLIALVECAGATVSKEQLIARVWPDTVVEETNLRVHIATLRKALGDGRGGRRFISNIAGRGYCFVAEIDHQHGQPAPSERATEPSLALPDKASIAVMPFHNMSGDPEQEYFADGMVEEIITALSRISWLFVIARNSTFTYKGRSVDVRQVGRELGVRYVLEGSVRKADQRVRIAGQLIDAFTGAHLWADRFDGSLEDIFELQDKVAVSVAGVIEPTLLDAETRRSTERPTGDLTAYDLYLRAVGPIDAGGIGREQILNSLDLLGEAINRDPRYGLALGAAALCYQALHLAGWISEPDAKRLEALSLAHRALTVAGDNARVLGQVARVFGYFGEDLPGAIALMDRALERNPSFARGWHWSGWLRLWAGQPDVGIDHFGTSMRLNPLQWRGDLYLGTGVGHFLARRFDDAVACLLLSLQENPTWVPTHRFLASCYAHLGRFDEARETVRRLRTFTKEVIPSATHWRNPEHRELYLSGLRSATGEICRRQREHNARARAKKSTRA